MSAGQNTFLGSIGLCEPKEFNERFLRLQDYYEKTLCDYLKKNPEIEVWGSKIITTEPFPKEKGYSMTRFRYHSVPSPQVETDELWQGYGHSKAGLGSDPFAAGYNAAEDACSFECHTLGYGLESYSFSLQKLCLASPWVCAHDIQSASMLSEVLDAQAMNLARVVRGVKANWNRDKTLGFSQILPNYPNWKSHVSPSAPRGILPAIPPSGIQAPSIVMMDGLYDSLALQYGEWAMGTDNGTAIFGVMTSRLVAKYMRQNDPRTRTSDYYGDPKFYKEGFNKEYTFGGFAYLFDTTIPRYNENPDVPGTLLRVYPYEESPIEIGSRYDALPGAAYDTATYEAMIVLFKDQFTNVPFSLNTSPGGGVKWGDVDYTGKVTWQRFQDCNDEDSLRGRYRMKMIQGARPGCHDAGIAFIVKRPDYEQQLAFVADNPFGCNPCDGTPPTEAPALALACVAVVGEDQQLSITDPDLDAALTDTDTAYVTFANGVQVEATTTGEPSDTVIILDFGFDVDCETYGGVGTISSVGFAIGICPQLVGLSGGATHMQVTLVDGAVLPDATPAVSYTVHFRNGTDDIAELISVLNGVITLDFNADLTGTVDTIDDLGGAASMTLV